MSKFTGPLTITELDVDNEIWELHDTLVYYLIYEKLDDENGTVIKDNPIIVPATFRSDGASIPKILTWLFPRWGSYRRAAILHDFLGWCTIMGYSHPLAPDRNVSDKIFYDAMGSLNTPQWVRIAIFIGAKIGTWFPSLRKSVITNTNSNDHLYENLKLGKLFVNEE